MNFAIHFTPEAGKQYRSLSPIKLKKIRRVLGCLQTNPRHPSLHTHLYRGYTNPFDPSGAIFEAYAENKTPGAYRVFWCYGPDRGAITVLAIIPHP